MTTSNTNQHWVPKFYLNYFATPETRERDTKRIWALPKEDGKEFLTNVQNVAAQRYLYSPLREDGTRDDEVDSELREVESLLGRLWPSIAHDHYPLDEGLRYGLSLFISTLFLRHPSKLERHRKFRETMVQALSEAPLDDSGNPFVDTIEIEGKIVKPDQSTWDWFRNASGEDIKRSWGEMILDNGGFFAKHLLTLPWSMVFSEEEVFVTSDHPVTLAHREIRRPNLNAPGAIVYFPISPTRMLVIGEHRMKDGHIHPLRPRRENHFNFFVYRSAHRYMFSPWHPARTLAGICTLQDELEAEMRAEGDRVKCDAFSQVGLKIGRNEPCPCGSGRKFKRCCGG